jgi:Cu/Ag efflux protein CusF
MDHQMTGSTARRHVAAIAALLAAAVVPALAQQQTPADAGQPGAPSVVKITASVEGVDVANRTVTLKGPRGRIVTLPVGPEVQALHQVKAGDIVVVRYLEALALDLKKPGSGARERPDTPPGAAARPGERGPADVRQTAVVADVIGVDPKRQTVTLRAGRRTFYVKVRDPNQVKLLKPGDQLEATYTEAVAIAIEPAPRAARLTQLGF